MSRSEYGLNTAHVTMLSTAERRDSRLKKFQIALLFRNHDRDAMIMSQGQK